MSVRNGTSLNDTLNNTESLDVTTQDALNDTTHEPAEENTTTQPRTQTTIQVFNQSHPHDSTQLEADSTCEGI